jgi:hypothetical protein
MSTNTTPNEKEKSGNNSPSQEKTPFKVRIKETLDEAMNFETKKIKHYIGPTGIWLLAYYFSSIFMMIILNIARVGFSGEAIFAAPAHFAQIFINYGLNAGKIDETIFEKIEFGRTLMSASWLFSPAIVYVLGILLSFFPITGYGMPEGYYQFEDNYRYFNQHTILLTQDGTNGFYFLIVWLPLILSILVSAFIVKRLFVKEDQNVNVFGLIIFNIFLAFIVGLQMGLMTGTYDVSVLGFFGTILRGTRDNTAVVFSESGHYHPNSIWITSAFVNLIPVALVIVWYAIYNLLEDKIIEWYLLIKNRNQQITVAE